MPIKADLALLPLQLVQTSAYILSTERMERITHLLNIFLRKKSSEQNLPFDLQILFLCQLNVTVRILFLIFLLCEENGS